MTEVSMTEVILIPEEHSNPQLTHMLVPIVKEYIQNRNFNLKKILNYSEGNKLNEFYTKIYRNDVKKTLSMVEESKKVLERNPTLFPCVKYMSSLLVELQNCLDFVRKSQQEGRDIRKMRGLQGLPFNEQYLTRILFEGYKFQDFICYEQDIVMGYESFYNMLNTAYIDALLGRPAYEENLKIALNNAKRYFSKSCSYDDFFTQTLDRLIDMNSPEERKPFIIETRRYLRNKRDTMTMERITEAVTSRELELVIIYVGASHYDSLKQMVELNETMRMSDIQPTIESLVSPLLIFARSLNQTHYKSSRENKDATASTASTTASVPVSLDELLLQSTGLGKRKQSKKKRRKQRKRSQRASIVHRYPKMRFLENRKNF
jgi:hypothetical protein